MVKKKESTNEGVSDEIKSESKKFTKFVSKNYWMIATVLLALVLIGVLIYNSATTISANKAGEKLISFASSQGVELSIVNITEQDDFYAILAEIQGQQGLFYITKDGKYFTASILELAEEETTPTITGDAVKETTEVPKSDKPEVELYVWGYCPYGVQAQGPMAEVAQLLKASADFEIVPYYDGHGAYETQQNKIQSCIQKLYPEKYWTYAGKFVSDVYTKCSSVRTEDCDKTESVKVMKAVGIDSAKVMSCVSSDGAGLIATAAQKAQTNGVTGSPTVIINGVKVNVARTSEAIKTAVCSAFNNAPSACGEVLSGTTTASTGSC